MHLSVSDRVSATIAYMESHLGLVAWENNRVAFGMTRAANIFAAIQTATRLRKYEEITAVYNAIGPALNARNCGRVA